MTYVGIDYGLTSQTNRDKETGVHYGVISQHSVGEAWYEDSEADYGPATCPKCGNEAADYNDLDEEFVQDWDRSHGCTDYACGQCRYVFDASEAYGDEPNGYSYDSDGYVLTSCLDSDIMVIKSPYYTRAQFCWPCVPGAGNLDNPTEDGPKTYCLGHDWFEDGVAPYPVYDLATGARIVRAKQETLDAQGNG